MTVVAVMLLSAPQVAPEQPLPASVQFTPRFCVSFCRVALNNSVPIPVCTVAGEGRMEMEIAGATVTITWELKDFVESASATAVIVTVGGLGGVAGAVYLPAVVIVP